MTKLETTVEDGVLITKIVIRMRMTLAADLTGYEPLEAHMDLSACHLNGCPLRLADLLAASEFDFIHDLSSIRKFIDRSTGRMPDWFSPRFHAPYAS